MSVKDVCKNVIVLTNACAIVCILNHCQFLVVKVACLLYLILLSINTYSTIFLHVFLRYVSRLAPMAKYANLAMVIVLISVYGLAFRALKEVGIATSFVETPHTPQAFFLFCGNCFYSFEGVATIVPLIAAMEDQAAVPRVLGTALAVILALQVAR